MTQKIAVLAGDGIGPEIVAEAVKVLNALKQDGLDISLEEGLIGGAAYDASGTPLPAETLALAKHSDAILLGAVGGYKWESLDISVRPEKGLLAIRFMVLRHNSVDSSTLALSTEQTRLSRFWAISKATRPIRSISLSR